MNYEKKYNEALERARKIHNDTDFDYEKGMMEEIFPELKESEDERIRKALITFFKRFPYDSIEQAGTNAKEAIAWLEKQGGTSKEWTISDAATLKELIDFLENGTAKLQHDLTRYANWLKIQFTPIEKKSEQKSTDKAEPIPERR